jgi:hypothetical protein
LKREQIFSRDDYHCVYCGERFEPEDLTVDHVQPRMRGGDRSGGNLVTACGGCNVRKGGLRLADFLRADPIAQRIFLERAARYIWPRIMRTLEEELKKGGLGTAELEAQMPRPRSE